ncbi:YcxB family protein [Micromonospora globispora]|uniref:YcxB family protein n=1 Tax=Micromonospora globispora TaxID=1450148 RepID=UPI0034D96682
MPTRRTPHRDRGPDRSSRSDHRSEVLWTAVVRVVETDSGWLLYYGSRHAISVPKDALNEDQEAQFRALLGTRSPVAA